MFLFILLLDEVSTEGLKEGKLSSRSEGALLPKICGKSYGMKILAVKKGMKKSDS